MWLGETWKPGTPAFRAAIPAAIVRARTSSPDEAATSMREPGPTQRCTGSASALVPRCGQSSSPIRTMPSRRASITAVAVVDVAPMAEYGGWGLRFIPGSTGVLMRGGEGIQVTLTSGRTFVVTVDDAATGAGLLKAVTSGSQTTSETEPGREGEPS